MPKTQMTLERPNPTLATSPLAEQCDSRKPKPDARHVPWYASILCRVGLHWGEWQYVTERNCSQILVCGRCSQTRLRTRHQRQWVYIRERCGDQVRICQRCQAESGTRTEHKWGPDTYRGDEGTHTCQRCGKNESWTVSNG